MNSCQIPFDEPRFNDPMRGSVPVPRDRRCQSELAGAVGRTPIALGERLPSGGIDHKREVRHLDRRHRPDVPPLGIAMFVAKSSAFIMLIASIRDQNGCFTCSAATDCQPKLAHERVRPRAGRTSRLQRASIAPAEFRGKRGSSRRSKFLLKLLT